MASGSSPHHNPDSGSGLDSISSDFAPDTTHFDSSVGITHDRQVSRISQASMSTTATNVCNQLNESLCQEMISALERTMKKNEDNLMRFLEGISSRLSQLELYCYNLDKSVGQMRSDLDHDHSEADSKLKSLEKQIQEVHRSVQVLGDKQEIAKTQKELAKKLQLAQKESLCVVHEERTVASAAESKTPDDSFCLPNTKLTLALPSEVSLHPSHAIIQQQVVTSAPLPPPQNFIQAPSYYLPSTQLPNPVSQPQPSYAPVEAQYQPQGHQQLQTQVKQTPQIQQFPQFSQQWSQEVNQSPPMQSQNQVQAPTLQSSAHSPCVGAEPSPPESMARTMPMLVSFPGVPLQAVSQAGTLPYSFDRVGGSIQSQPSAPHLKGGFPSQPLVGMYMLYGNEGGQPHVLPQPNHYSQGTCPTGNVHVIHSSSPPFVRNRSYNELIEKLTSMGFRGDHVMGVIQMLEESGQPVDFNVVLDRLNGHPPGGSQRGW